MEAWSNFFVAQVGATAALAGLVIVAISINLSQILAQPQLPGRAGETLCVLVGVLILSSLALVPGQPGSLLAGEWLAIGIVMWIFPSLMIVRSLRIARAYPAPRIWIRIVLMQGEPSCHPCRGQPAPGLRRRHLLDRPRRRVFAGGRGGQYLGPARRDFALRRGTGRDLPSLDTGAGRPLWCAPFRRRGRPGFGGFLEALRTNRR